MIQTAYISSATRPMSPDELLALLRECLANNARRGVTGLLLYGNDTFLQTLEGEEGVVDELVAKISRDPRHGNIQILHRKPIEGREYMDWSMAFKRVSVDELHDIEGLKDFGERDFNFKNLSVNNAVVETLMNHYRAPHWDPLIRELDAQEKVIDHLKKALAQARGRIDIASLVLHSVVEASKRGGLDQSHLRLCESALDSLKSAQL